MIKATGERDGRPFLLLGIDAENVMRLKDGQPILVRKDEVGTSHDVLIMYGATARDIIRELKSYGINLPAVPRVGRGHSGGAEP